MIRRVGFSTTSSGIAFDSFTITNVAKKSSRARLPPLRQREGAPSERPLPPKDHRRIIV
jgi:hypothetical protein